MHDVTEAYDRGIISKREALAEGEFSRALDRAVADAIAKGETEIKASGKQLQKHGKTGGPGKKDRAWWEIEGPQMIAAYIDWREITGWEIPTLWDGEPAIEVKVTFTVDGQEQVGYIDRVFIDHLGRIVIVDLKTGKLPQSKLQLGTYALAFLREYGLRAEFAAYWMGGTGSLTDLFDVTAYTDEFVEHQYRMAWTGIKAGVFLATPGNFCSSCGVREFCRTMGGRQAASIPVVEEMLPPRPTKDPRQQDVAQLTQS